MTWFNTEYRRRQLLVIDATDGADGDPAIIDAEIEVPEDWDDLWENIRSDLKDVVVTDAKGKVLDFARKSGANYNTRTLTLQIENFAIDNDQSSVAVYIYYFNPDETEDRTSDLGVLDPKYGYVMLSAPHSRVVNQSASQSSLDSPVQSFVKGSDEKVHVYFLINQNFANRISPYNERNDEEGIEYVQVFSYDSNGANDTTRYIAGHTMFGNGFVRATFRGGTSGTDYAIGIQFKTTLNQLIEMRAILRVIDLLP